MSGVRKLNGSMSKSCGEKILYTRKEGGTTVWRNPSTSVLSSVTAYVPCEILYVMRQLEDMVPNSRLEYGLYLKGQYSAGVLKVSSEYMIPEQLVTGSTIDFVESDGNEFNGVIHRHPMDLRTFSGTDKESINQNYEFSLLYTGNNIVTGIVNIPLPDGYGRAQINCDVIIEYPTMNISQELVNSKIKVKPTQVAEPRKLTNVNCGNQSYFGYTQPPKITHENSMFNDDAALQEYIDTLDQEIDEMMDRRCALDDDCSYIPGMKQFML